MRESNLSGYKKSESGVWPSLEKDGESRVEVFRRGDDIFIAGKSISFEAMVRWAISFFDSGGWCVAARRFGISSSFKRSNEVGLSKILTLSAEGQPKSPFMEVIFMPSSDGILHEDRVSDGAGGVLDRPLLGAEIIILNMNWKEDYVFELLKVKPFPREGRGDEIFVRKDWPVRLGDGRLITCKYIANIAYAIYSNRLHFKFKRGIESVLHADINGSGTQHLKISFKNGKEDQFIFSVYFSSCNSGDDDLIYEADLFVDGGRRWNGVMNRGLHYFSANCAFMSVRDGLEFIDSLRRDLDRISKSPRTLREYVNNGFDLLLICGRGGGYCRARSELLIFRNAELRDLLTSGGELDDVVNGYSCKVCRSRKVVVVPL